MERLLFILTMTLTALMANAQSCPDGNHPHGIDLGLSSGTKWACCNVGTTTPESFGGYYAWGETKEKEIYDWTTYIHSDSSMETCHNLGSDIASTEFDVAHVQWGSSWMMPSQSQFQELINECSCTWTRRNGVGGELFTGPNGGTIFLPEVDFWRNVRNNSAVIYYNNDGLDMDADELPSAGYYWSSTLRESNSSYASNLLISNGYAYWDTYNYRSYGLTVRPVMSGVTNIVRPKSSPDETFQAVYNIYGIIIKDTKADIRFLPPGIYLQNGRKYVAK